MKFLRLGLVGLLAGAVGVRSENIGERYLSKRASSNSSSELLSDILDDAISLKTCSQCESLLTLMIEMANDYGIEPFTTLLVDFCLFGGLSSSETVCKNFMAREAPSLFNSVKYMKVPSRTATIFCVTIFGICQYPDPRPFDIPYLEAKNSTSNASNVSSSKREIQKRSGSSSGKKPLKVLHLSDIHVDNYYVTGASYNCSQLLCCQAFTPDEAPGITEYPAGEFGNHNCDAPYALEVSMYEAIKALAPDTNFTIFTGDIVEGVQSYTTNNEIYYDIARAFEMMNQTGLVYGAIGNHEANPVNSFPLLNQTTPYNDTYIYEELYKYWLPWIGTEAASTVVSQGGSYVVMHKDTNLKIIVIHTMFWMKENFWIYTEDMALDPSNELTWLAKELSIAEAAGNRVWLLGHIPPGHPDMVNDYSIYWNKILLRYKDTIAAIFTGHVHRDEFEIGYSNFTDQSAETASIMAYITPALTPTSGYPNFRIYSIDPDTFDVVDFTEYYSNMSAPGYQTKPVWEKYYSVKEAYGTLLDPPVTDEWAPLSPAFWHNLTVLFEKNDTVFQEFYTRKTRGWQSGCDASCKKAEICRLRSTSTEYNCLSQNEAVSLKKREMVTSQPHDHMECPGSQAAKALRLMSNNLDILRKSLKGLVI